jgi:hypothetical protein
MLDIINTCLDDMTKIAKTIKRLEFELFEFKNNKKSHSELARMSKWRDAICAPTYHGTSYNSAMSVIVKYDMSSPVTNQHRLLTAALGLYKIAPNKIAATFNTEEKNILGFNTLTLSFGYQVNFEYDLTKQLLGVPPGDVFITVYRKV